MKPLEGILLLIVKITLDITEIDKIYSMETSQRRCSGSMHLVLIFGSRWLSKPYCLLDAVPNDVAIGKVTKNIKTLG